MWVWVRTLCVHKMKGGGGGLRLKSAMKNYVYRHLFYIAIGLYNLQYYIGIRLVRKCCYRSSSGKVQATSEADHKFILIAHLYTLLFLKKELVQVVCEGNFWGLSVT